MRIIKKLKFNEDEVNLKLLELLHEELATFDYGTIIDGHRYDEKQLDEVDWDKYRTLPIETIETEKIGNCWDFVNYQHDFFQKNNVDDKSYFFVMKRSKDDSDVVTHAFSIVESSTLLIWFEHAFYKYRGAWEIHSLEDVVNVLRNYYDPEGKYNFSVYRYDPEGLDNHLSGKEFFNSVTSIDPVI